MAAGSVVWRYDPGTDRWTEFARRSRDWWNAAGGLVGTRFYLVEEFGGEMDILDLASGAWTTGPARPYRACNAASATLQAKLYLFGQCDDHPTDPEQRQRGLVFNPATGSWSTLTPAPITALANAALARVVVNGQPRLSMVRGTRPNNHVLFTP